ncbi:unnamed protein product [Larinioides sclopetarius]|uniref:Uncharacterized protein n=1 Tax=Larinioides sclopetarius TaxID=280406 RepID=A0AAV2BMD6_9ARAC
MFRFQFELSYLAEPMLTMPMSTPWDSDTSQMEIQKSLDKTICVDDPHLPATSHVSTEDSEMDTSLIGEESNGEFSSAQPESLLFLVFTTWPPLSDSYFKCDNAGRYAMFPPTSMY